MERQSDLEARAEAGFADDHDSTLMARDDAVRSREAETRPFLTFGRVERLEDARHDFRRHARPCVCDPEAGAVKFGARTYFDVAAFGHGVHRIEEKIENHLAQLCLFAEYVNCAPVLD